MNADVPDELIGRLLGPDEPEVTCEQCFDTLDAYVETNSWTVPPLFQVLQRAGGVERDEMFRAFNMGVGMVAVCDPGDVEAVLSAASHAEVPAWRLGDVRPGNGAVILR